MQWVIRSAALSAALALAACSTELDGFGAKPSAVAANQVVPAAAGSMAASGGEAAGGDAPVAPAAAAAGAISPRTTAAAVPLAPPPAAPSGSAYAPTAAKEQMSGAWSFAWDNGRNTCPVTLSTSRGLSGMAAQADVSCPSEIFMTKGWDMMGSDLVLQNHQGKITARLRPSGPGRYVGVMTDSSQQVVLAR